VAHLDNPVFWFERKFLTLEYTAGAVFHLSWFWAEKKKVHTGTCCVILDSQLQFSSDNCR